MVGFANLAFFDELYQRYRENPNALEPSWRHFFEGWELGTATSKGAPQETEPDELRTYRLIEAYRTYGHLLLPISPLQPQSDVVPPQLALDNLGFSSEDLERSFSTHGFLQEAQAPLKTLLEALKKTYCQRIGFEYKGLGSFELETWVQKRIEPFLGIYFSSDQQRKILDDLTRAETLETFIHTKYTGQKRFSLEGGETLIPMLEGILEKAGVLGVSKVVFGMAHRGRLNVLANIMKKSYAHIFHEFEDHYSPDTFEGSGDVKYHKGFLSSLIVGGGHPMTLILAANSSSLESVDPIVEGQAKALQMVAEKGTQEVLPILIHGDASVAGEGVVYETLQCGRLKGYGTGGTLHIVVNNQIGFTTLPKEGRSTRYCTDIAKAFGAPVLHVDAEDPEGCVYAAQLALEIRQTFSCDVFLDLNCYRKYGHNEGDEPIFTQPIEYQIIRGKKTILDLYIEQLMQKGVLNADEAQKMHEEFRSSLQRALQAAQAPTETFSPPVQMRNSSPGTSELVTGVTKETLTALSRQLAKVPANFMAHAKVQRLFQDRVAMMQGDPQKAVVDWATAEILAYASLLTEGIHVRISGQDVRRGTFSHRHAMLIDQVNGTKYFPLSHLSSQQALFDIYNSPLSEFAILGFEFGYSMMQQSALVIWEAQYGDFSNNAQVVIDQYIAAAEQKWGHSSAIVMLLPHGYEGQGPEHSSARMERYLQLAANGNMRVVDSTTPAQFFHLLRKQSLDPIKKPLIVFTPKALLRHPLVLSAPEELEKGSFQTVLDDPTAPTKSKRLLFCTGKVYYDLVAEREKRGAREQIGIVRIEQLYPFDRESVAKIIALYPECKEYLWVQEEHANMGAWQFIQPLLDEVFTKRCRYVGRERSASTAAGSHGLHKKQYIAFMDEVFKL